MAQLEEAIHIGPWTLRRHKHSDLDDLASLCADESIVRYLYWNVRTREEVEVILEERIQRSEELFDDNVLPIAVAHGENDRLIGDFMLWWHENEHHQGEMGGSLIPSFHGQGIAGAVYREILKIGFEKYHLHRIVGRCDARNVPSIRSLEKAGLHQEAHLVQNEFVKGEWTDEVIMAIRRSEFVSVIKGGKVFKN